MRIALGLLALPASGALAATGGATGAAPCAPGTSAGYPSFCDIPPTPTDVRSPKAFRAAVVDLRRAGRRVVRASGPGTFGLPLGEADAFSRSAQAEAAPPPEIAAPPSERSEAAAAELRRRAAPPPRRTH
ncbi:hypothetical protein [Phenylobacterium sp.]|uniref:hypothetical protein n=1 Tax=Phenylobacterium sp. TaxID=1871053 RepID=UPI00261BA3F4|nr:hypothetical protein [Phenylobacterium sp.]